MNFKTSLLAAAVALVLAGCGSDDSAPVTGGGTSSELAKKASIAIPEQGTFIDAKVEGLYYVKGNLENGSGDFTNNDGSYSIDTENPSVTFILGNPEGGLVLGSVSGRSISTPYEALGTQERVIGLVRLLLTINTNSNDSAINVPQDIISAAKDSKVMKALEGIELDRIQDTTEPLLTLLGLSIDDLVDEDAALKHLEQSLSELNRGSDVKLTHWAKGSNWTFVSRSASQRIGQKNEDGSVRYHVTVHADRTLGDEVFKKTVGLASSTYTLADDAFITRAGSNDSSVSSGYAASYLSCVSENGEFGWNNDMPTCDGEVYLDTKPGLIDDRYYQYKLTDPTKFSQTDEKHTWEDVAQMGGTYDCMSTSSCSEKALSKFEIIKRDDSDNGDDSKLLKEISSGSYDPITDVYIETHTKEYLNGQHKGRIEERVGFMYPVEKPGDDRYVDFRGTWKVTATDPSCPGVTAIAMYTFDDVGLTMDGQEISNCKPDTLETTPYTYAEMAESDYWWFGTNSSGASKATLDQLNSTVRWNDRDEGDQFDSFKVNRFSYIPAGENWDRGVLTRYTLDDKGEKQAAERMQKVSN